MSTESPKATGARRGAPGAGAAPRRRRGCRRRSRGWRRGPGGRPRPCRWDAARGGASGRATGGAVGPWSAWAVTWVTWTSWPELRARAPPWPVPPDDAALPAPAPAAGRARSRRGAFLGGVRPTRGTASGLGTLRWDTRPTKGMPPPEAPLSACSARCAGCLAWSGTRGTRARGEAAGAGAAPRPAPGAGDRPRGGSGGCRRGRRPRGSGASEGRPRIGDRYQWPPTGWRT